MSDDTTMQQPAEETQAPAEGEQKEAGAETPAEEAPQQ